MFTSKKFTLFVFLHQVVLQSSYAAILRFPAMGGDSHGVFGQKVDNDASPIESGAWAGGQITPVVDALNIVKRAAGHIQVSPEELRQVLKDLQAIEQQINTMLNQGITGFDELAPTTLPTASMPVVPVPLITFTASSSTLGTPSESAVSTLTPDLPGNGMTSGFTDPRDAAGGQVQNMADGTPDRSTITTTIIGVEHTMTTTVARTFTDYVYGDVTALNTAAHEASEPMTSTLNAAMAAETSMSPNMTPSPIPAEAEAPILNPTTSDTGITQNIITASEMAPPIPTSPPEDLPDISLIVPSTDNGVVSFRTIALPAK